MGPLWADVTGVELCAADRELLGHPLLGGVVLFARNFESVEQLRRLTHDIHAVRTPALPVAVDHEGGRVQRFLDGFTRLPAMADIGTLPRATQLQAARAAGVIIAHELRACGLDLSFAPVLDLAVAGNLAIGTRAFAADPERVSTLGLALANGLRRGGFPAVAKHFPGHGSIRADSHVELPSDERALMQVRERDIVPFARWARARSGSIMTAHIRFPNIDADPVTFSPFWLRDVLRRRLGFDGLIFSDDLGMQAARQMGTVAQSACKALDAGCDIVLVCNDQTAAASALDALARRGEPPPEARAVHAARVCEFWLKVPGQVGGAVDYAAARHTLRVLGLTG